MIFIFFAETRKIHYHYTNFNSVTHFHLCWLYSKLLKLKSISLSAFISYDVRCGFLQLFTEFEYFAEILCFLHIFFLQFCEAKSSLFCYNVSKDLKIKIASNFISVSKNLFMWWKFRLSFDDAISHYFDKFMKLNLKNRFFYRNIFSWSNDQ